MAGAGSESPPFRASDADRERVVRVLRDSAVDGRLMHDSFVRRVHLALRAQDQQLLDALVADLPGRRPPVMVTVFRAWSGHLAEQLTPRAGGRRLPTLKLPGPRQPVATIGRGRHCDLVLTDPTVSRVHAVLRRFGDEWFLEDVGSTNGTRLNGFTLRKATVVRPGDRVGFGSSAFRVGRSVRR